MWGADIAIALLIFSVGIYIFYQYSTSALDVKEQGMDNLLIDAKLVSNYLVSSGYPADWEPGNAVIIGLTNGSMDLDANKVGNFNNIALADYDRSRLLLSTDRNYYVTFEDKDNNTVNIDGVDEIGANYKDSDPEQLIKILRFVNYDSQIIRLVLYVW